MSFLDNLENNLKALESLEQGGIEDNRRRESERALALAAAPWAEKLKQGIFTKNLMALATRAGYPRRLKVNLLWVGTTLRLEAGGERLELRPEAKGVAAVFLAITPTGVAEVSRQLTNLEGSPQKLVNLWMERVDEWRKQEEALSAASLPVDDEEA